MKEEYDNLINKISIKIYDNQYWEKRCYEVIRLSFNNFNKLSLKKIEELKNIASLKNKLAYFQDSVDYNGNLSSKKYYKVLKFIISMNRCFMTSEEKACLLIEMLDYNNTVYKVSSYYKNKEMKKQLWLKSKGFYSKEFIELEKNYFERLQLLKEEKVLEHI